MQYNPFTLSFHKKLESEYQDNFYEESVSAFRIAFLLAILMYVLFGYVESLYKHEYEQVFNILHFGIIIPFLCLIFLLSYLKIFKKTWQIVVLIGFIFAALSKIVMIVLIPDNWVYYTGLMLIYSAGFFVFKLRFIYATIAGWIVFIAFNVGVIFLAEVDIRTIITYNFFYLAVIMFGMFAAYNIELYNRKSFYLTSQLDAKEAEKLREQVEMAKKSVEFKQNFLANMSHEIRTPLTGLMGMIELLGKTNLDNVQNDYINTLKHSTENLHEIINQVLDYSKIEAGKLKLNIKVFQFQSLLINAKKLFGSICDKDIDFKMHVSKDVPVFIKADKSRIMQVINNLISNAVKFTNKGTIRLDVEHVSTNINTKEAVIKIIVSDTGYGIRPEKQDQLFVPFSQIDELDTRDYDGTGLGLSICKELVSLHGGEIGFESEYKVGSKFWFTFKAGIADWDDVPSLINTDESFNSTKSLRILLAEDKPINQKVINLLLESMGHKVTIAKNGKEAVDMFKPGEFDLILMDVQMPVMDGIAATQTLKGEHVELPPIVGLSANAFEGDSEKYKNLGMDEYITKPFKSEDFTYVVNKFF
ncbi:MAG: ATP-binding protein [Bacteroidota bacterium]